VQIFKTEVCDGIIAPGFEPEALEILKNKKKVMGNSDINTVTLSCFVVDDLDNEFI
jgi:AICAR transformylase/IMP cyclohydrolase PurH